MAVSSHERRLAIGLGCGRIAIGVGLWLAPGVAARALGFGELDSRALALGRIAATRDLVLGTWQLSALGDRDRLAHATAAVAACDAGDTLTFALAMRSGGEAREAGLRGVVGAALATASGAWLARRLASA